MRNHAIFVSQKLSVVGQQLGGHSLVELMTVNKALLGRQPKPLNYFGNRFFFVLSLLSLILLVLILMYLCCRFRGSEVVVAKER